MLDLFYEVKISFRPMSGHAARWHTSPGLSPLPSSQMNPSKHEIFCPVGSAMIGICRNFYLLQSLLLWRSVKEMNKSITGHRIP